MITIFTESIVPSILLLLLSTVMSQKDGDIRLQDGSAPTEGRVELFLNSTWGGVCDDRWTNEDAVVVCRQLNLSWTGAEVVSHGSFKSGTSSYVVDDVHCSGDERRLIDCPHNSKPNCDTGLEDAGVRCLQRALPTYVNGSGEVRLRDGSGSNSGRVEVFLNGSWSAICNDYWSIADARVVCRQLGYNVTDHSVASMEATIDGEVITPANKFLCEGNEGSLIECPHSLDGDYYCYHAAVTCLPVITDLPEGSICLRGGSSSMTGRLEVLVNRVWGTVCNDRFTRRSAEAVCRQLNFNGTEGRIKSASSGVGPIWLANVNCTGSENSIFNCPHSSSTSDCDHSQDVGIECYNYTVCKEGEIQLVNGTTQSEGRVEMCYRDAWSSICHTLWDSRDASQVCRQLTLPFTAALPFRNAYFGEGSGLISYDRIRCTNPNGRTVIDDCYFSTSPRRSCSHSRDAGVRCASADQTFKSSTIRLVGGRTSLEGRVEILLDGRWGTICANQNWNAAAAATVCRQLGLSTNGSIALSDSTFGPGAADQPIHMDGLSCSGDEPGPQACVFTMGGSSSCSHSNDASVMCLSPPVPSLPQKFEVQLRAADCTKVTFTWLESGNVQYPNLYHYIIKVVSLDAKRSQEIRVPINETSCTVTLECGVSYVSFITAYVLTTPGHDSNVVIFKTGTVYSETSKSPTPEPALQEMEEISSGVLAVVVLTPLVLLVLIGILFMILLIICIRNKVKFRTFGSHSNSSNLHAVNECSFENELKSQSIEGIHNPTYETQSNGDSTGLIVKSH